jgi:hypothetical protein
VTDRVGDKYLVPVIWTGFDVDEMPFDIFPKKFVIKTNHGCGFNIFVKDKTIIVPSVVKRHIDRILSSSYGEVAMGIQWGYKNIKPCVLVEEFIEENGKPPLDYKFFCFSGRAEYILITYDRFGSHQEKHFTRDFVPLDLWNGAEQYKGPFIRPKNFDKMLEIADTLSAGMDFIRVDLYNVEGKIYFGEMTVYPAGGLAPFVPREWDFIFGSKWKLAKD